MDLEKKALIEAALFMSSSPLSLTKLSKLTGLKEDEIKDLLEKIKEELNKSDRGLELVETPVGYELRVKPFLTPKVASLAPFSDLSDGMVRTLALIIALGDKVTQSLIVKYQGNKAYGYIKELEKKGLIRTEKFGRTKLIKITKEFERYFGMSLDEIRKKIKESVKIS